MEVEEKKTPVEQPELSSGNSEQKDFVDYNSHQKLLDEKKKLSSKFISLEEELKQLREEKMQREGKQTELLDEYKKQINDLSSKLKQKDQTYAWNTLTGEIKREALKHGCTDPDKLIRLMDDEDLKSIEIGDNFSINKETLSGVIEKNKRDNFFLFETAKKIPVNGNPSTKIEETDIKDLSKLSMEELKALHKKSYK